MNKWTNIYRLVAIERVKPTKWFENLIKIK